MVDSVVDCCEATLQPKHSDGRDGQIWEVGFVMFLLGIEGECGCCH